MCYYYIAFFANEVSSTQILVDIYLTNENLFDMPQFYLLSMIIDFEWWDNRNVIRLLNYLIIFSCRKHEIFRRKKVYT